MSEAPIFVIGDLVAKTNGDYIFYGQVRAIFTKRSGAVRYVVENDDGVLHIFNEKQIRPAKRRK